MLVRMKLDPQRGGVVNNVIHKTKSLKLWCTKGTGLFWHNLNWSLLISMHSIRGGWLGNHVEHSLVLSSRP